MGIFSKFSTLLKSNINDLISRAENPEKMLNQIILDMRDQLAKAKREVAAAIADERKLRSQLDEEVKQTRDWERRAMLAVKEGRDDLAKQALMRQQEHAQRVQMLEQTWRAQADETEKLKGSLRQLNDKIEEAKRKRNLLIAKQKRAQAQRRIHETMSGLSDTSAFEAFNRMAEKIEESERKSLAAAEVDEALGSDTLETEFTRLEAGGGDSTMDDKLLALKQEMGLLPGSEKPKALGAGEDDDAAEAGDAEVQEAEVEPVEDDRDDGGIAEAELLEQFKNLENRNAGA
ncbi:PspA/IM30 family protein [Gaopeijia maritima]|uniref:PspA/IM30 family protein n=1 Tax=Gaopeijia maritima TaxID=3119007 RepID=A0ABU9E860_9BACT